MQDIIIEDLIKPEKGEWYESALLNKLKNCNVINTKVEIDEIYKDTISFKGSVSDFLNAINISKIFRYNPSLCNDLENAAEEIIINKFKNLNPILNNLHDSDVSEILREDLEFPFSEYFFDFIDNLDFKMVYEIIKNQVK